jgi:exopolyphosphatase/guanosine-5'-triphosphate,3'-diphosphate pyrophosphatase
MISLEHQSEPKAGRIAVIDVGSNSTHMLVVEVVPGAAFRILEAVKEQTRLAADLDERLMLDANALNKMSAVLKKMRDIADRYNAQIRCVATHTLREAKNGGEFASRLSKKSGVQVDIVSGQEEARLVALGVRHGLPIAGEPTLIVDVGGGSTEIVLCQWNEVRFATSLKLGAVRLTQKFLKDDPFSERDLRALEEYVVSRLEPVCHEIRKIGFDVAVGSSGTIKTLQMLSMASRGEEIPKNLHGTDLEMTNLSSVCETLFKNRSIQERRFLPKMDSKRADIIVAGAMVLKVLGDVAGISSFRVSSTALREGLIVDTLSRESTWLQGDSIDVRWQSIRELGSRLRIDEAHAWHITSLTISLFDCLELKPALGPQWRELLRCAAYLHECGKFINISGFHKHAQYLIRNSSLMGFNQKELEIIGALVRFHRKRPPRQDDDQFEHIDQQEAQTIGKLASILRLAVSLDRGRMGRIRKVRLVNGRSGRATLTLSALGPDEAGVELYELNCEKEPFEKAFSTALDVRVEAFRA